MKREAPLYDRRRLEALVTAHKMRVHRGQKTAGRPRRNPTGAKTPR